MRRLRRLLRWRTEPDWLRLRLGFNVILIWDLNHFWFLESHVNIWCDRWVRHVDMRDINQVSDILMIVLSN